jgi:hypothetical protein
VDEGIHAIMGECMSNLRLFVLSCCVLFAGALSAQADIDIEYPVGNSLANNATIDYGNTDNGEAILLTIRIENAGSSTLTMGATPVVGSNYESVQVNITGTPLPGATINAGASVDITVDINPDKNSDWSFRITFNSDSPGETAFVIKLKGTEGEPKKEEEDCSTNGGSGLSLLMLMGLLSAGLVAVRLRAARA